MKTVMCVRHEELTVAARRRTVALSYVITYTVAFQVWSPEQQYQPRLGDYYKCKFSSGLTTDLGN